MTSDEAKELGARCTFYRHHLDVEAEDLTCVTDCQLPAGDLPYKAEGERPSCHFQLTHSLARYVITITRGDRAG